MRASAGVSAVGSTGGGSGTVGTSGWAGTRCGRARDTGSPAGGAGVAGGPVGRPGIRRGRGVPGLRFGGWRRSGLRRRSYGSRRGKLVGSYDGRAGVGSADGSF